MTTYLDPTPHIDSHDPNIVAFARDAAKGVDPQTRAIAIYRAVRDAIVYNPYVDFNDRRHYTASGPLALGYGFCIGKAALLAACLRSQGIPARVGYADVRNHMTSKRFHQLTRTDVFRWHSYTDVCLDGRWVKATPAFDAALCQRVGLTALDFDGQADSLFQPFDGEGRRRMEYLLDRGPFEDVPFDAILDDFKTHYPALLAHTALGGDFRAEAVAGEAASAMEREGA